MLILLSLKNNNLMAAKEITHEIASFLAKTEIPFLSSLQQAQCH